ncbi:isochorismatase family cysteine hydrolase [Pseudoxanthomonas wuyuanensis]|uniref:Nicotinamidase-related amidase n=1 Tax=Pseudoxanthomonas wuyuanensis TaxID=1073196 RepID=A0A286D5W5_9GAMM|nr:isochorismatase family cysteine hydrolase [Pseudoxanthomonas wuyuanensis]KAF1719210.1 cysteine hydrolase [Pseudoxanthomonas wuyuanensis]SOD54026.1 Nicotinamidase-related amidase [Pseudoxanthomonas wuyuanensis]
MAQRPALMILDMINLFDFEGGSALSSAALACVPRLLSLRDRFDAASCPVIYVNDNFTRWQGEFADLIARCIDSGGDSARIAAALAPRGSDYYVLKPKHSAFQATALPVLLGKLEVDRVVLAGISADSCILATAQDAKMREYPIWVPSDAVAAISKERKEMALKLMDLSLQARVDSTFAVRQTFPP